VKRVVNLLRRSEGYLNLASAGVIILMLLVISLSVIMRQIINRPITGVYEGSELCMLILVFLGLAYTQMRGKNVAVTLFYDKFPARSHLFIDIAIQFLSIGFWGLLTWQSLLRTITSWQMQECSIAVMRFPLYPSWTVITIGAALLTVELILQLCCGILRIDSHEGN